MLKLAKSFTTPDGIKCASITEGHFHMALTKIEIPFIFQHKIELYGPAVHRPSSQKERARLPLIRDRGIEAICLTVDFVFEYGGITYYCDTKGSKKHVQRDSKMRYDMLKRKLYNEGLGETTRVLFISAAEVKTLSQLASYGKQTETHFWNAFLQIKER